MGLGQSQLVLRCGLVLGRGQASAWGWGQGCPAISWGPQFTSVRSHLAQKGEGEAPGQTVIALRASRAWPCGELALFPGVSLFEVGIGRCLSGLGWGREIPSVSLSETPQRGSPQPLRVEEGEENRLHDAVVGSAGL